MEAFKEALKNEEIETSKTSKVHREKRQLMGNITLNSLNDLELSHASWPKEEEQQVLATQEYKYDRGKM